MSTGKKRSARALWRDLFSNTSQWWDHRPEKTNPRFPDFKHKQTQESLWLVDSRTPSWVQTELAAMPPGKLQSHAFAWTERLKRHVKAGEHRRTMEVYYQMQQEKILPDARTFLPVLNACASLKALEEGRHIHTQVIQVGHESDIYVATSLIDMYAKCGSIGDAWSVFNKMQEHNVVAWNAIIGGHVKSGQAPKALELFRKMQQEGVKPDAFTFVGVLNACAGLAALDEGRRVHMQIIQAGCESDVYVANCLLDMYAKCGSIEDAWSVFNKSQEHSVVTWTAMIGGYVKAGNGLKAMELFREMQQEGVEPNAVTYVAALSACASIPALKEGRLVHTEIIQAGFDSDVYLATCLVDMYAKCGSTEDARTVFNKMQEHDVATWNAMIGGHVKSGQGLKAMELFDEMKQEGVKPDLVTFIGMLNACASVAALEEGRRVHEQIIRSGRESDVYIVNCLVDMYAKCGSIEDALGVFNKMRDHDVSTWNAMISGYAVHGQAYKAIELFEQMVKESVEINGVTFVCLLSACSHGGLVKEGLCYFKSMSSCFNILPTVEHYSCMVDLLARAGQLGEAEELITRTPSETDITFWMSLLGACRTHGNIEVGERAAKRCWELDPGNASGYVLLANIYAAPGKRASQE